MPQTDAFLRRRGGNARYSYGDEVYDSDRPLIVPIENFAFLDNRDEDGDDMSKRKTSAKRVRHSGL